MAYDRDRENSYGGFQYRWNYDEYQKSLQRKRKKSAARGMRAFCLTTVFVFLLCTASLLIVLTASLLRGAANALPTVVQTDKTVGLPLSGNDDLTAPANPPTPAEQTSPITEPIDESDIGPAPVLDGNSAGNAAPAPAEKPVQNTPTKEQSAVQNPTKSEQASLSENYAASDNTDLFSALTLSEIAQTCSASAVTVQCASKGYQGIGSGFFLTDDGYIVTNYHVIRPYDTYSVISCDGTSYEAQLVTAEPEYDLAILKIDAEQMPVVTVGDSDGVAVGDQVVAIGTPGSVNFAGTVTYGYISGLDRRVEVTDHDDTVISYVDMIQITAAINPGNSGGPLFNCFGEVIAINTMKLSGDGYEGMGFAIPIDDVYPLLTDRIRAHREENARVTDAPETDSVTEALPETEPTGSEETKAPADTDVIVPDERPHAALGVKCETVTEKESDLYKIPVGVILSHIEEGSYAMKNNLRVGDIILSVNGTQITDVAALNVWAENIRVGDTAEITVFRAGNTVTLTVSFADETPVESTPEITDDAPAASPAETTDPAPAEDYDLAA